MAKKWLLSWRSEEVNEEVKKCKYQYWEVSIVLPQIANAEEFWERTVIKHHQQLKYFRQKPCYEKQIWSPGAENAAKLFKR